MNSIKPRTILCLASYEKGHAFLRQCKLEGWRVLLLTSQSLRDKASWPRESIDDVFYVPDVDKEWNMNDVISGVSYLAWREQIDRIVALDDFDVERAAMLREHLRIGGMGITTARYFRDKLAMRTKARSAGIRVPQFVHTLNQDTIRQFLKSVQPPYVLKPRQQAGAIGIKKMESGTELWETLEGLGDKKSFYLLEQFVPGNVFHVDSLVYDNNITLNITHAYGLPPMEVAHQGRVFSSRTLPRGSHDDVALQRLNRQLLSSLGLLQGVSHTEFIKSSQDGEFYFLETSARVGGAHISELVHASTGLDLWAEWARIETADDAHPYTLPPHQQNNAGLLISLARQEWPDMSAYHDPEVVWRLQKKHHAGLIVSSPSYERVESLLAAYTERFYRDFFTSQPMRDRPTD
jgi:biotin carboxylase